MGLYPVGAGGQAAKGSARGRGPALVRLPLGQVEPGGPGAASRHPGCDNLAGWADADHVVPHAAGGATDCANLCCLCRRHHRLKTLAPGWTYAITPDGILTVRAPSGVTRTSRPPGLQLSGPRVITRPPAPGRDQHPPAPDPADDPPPF